MEGDGEIKNATKKGEVLFQLLEKDNKNLDYNSIFKIIIDTNNFQRQVINKYIEFKYYKSLIQIIKEKFSGNLEEVLIYMFYSPYELDARLIYNALNIKINIKVIIEIFATRPKWYLEIMDKEYEKIYSISLKTEFSKQKKSLFKLLLCLFENEREEGQNLDKSQAEKIVEEINKNGIKMYGNNVELFKKVFVEKSREDFILICRVFFEKNKKKNIYQVCDEQGGENKELLKSLVYAICDPPHYFAHTLKRAMVGIGTNSNVLNRILVFRSEIDMDLIRKRYFIETQRELINDIKRNSSGYYFSFLSMLVNKGNS